MSDSRALRTKSRFKIRVDAVVPGEIRCQQQAVPTSLSYLSKNILYFISSWKLKRWNVFGWLCERSALDIGAAILSHAPAICQTSIYIPDTVFRNLKTKVSFQLSEWLSFLAKNQYLRQFFFFSSPSSNWIREMAK
ncbi:hypothetical protein CEXT_410351 [Caerostris extrusa]|uniref:Uncharacterized protein n=1 Tax=Caerostris extrusa TaxID=172846 RepID=A0AAV4UMH4_CAEEX|nr:hypothetical protein CEXT_410351 [Caerostris extrusa]